MNLKLRGLSVCAVVAVSGAGFAQSKTLTFSELVSGNSGIPLSMKISRMPASFKPIRISDGASGGGLMDMIMSPMMMMMGALGGAMGGGKGDTDSMAALQMLDVSWTRGQVVALEGQRYLVSYKIGLDMSMMATTGQGNNMPNFAAMPLKLSLIRVDGIKSIAPAPEVTRTSYIKALTPPKPKPAAKQE